MTVHATDSVHLISPATQPNCTTGNPNWTTTIDATTLNDGSGNITITADLTDLAGNSATTAQVIIGKDTVAPTADSIQIMGPENYAEATNDLNVTASLSATEATSSVGDQCVAEGTDCSSCTYDGSWSGTKNLTFASSTPEVKSVSFKIKDGAGNESGCTTGSIILEDITVRWKYSNRNKIASSAAWGLMKNGTPDNDDCDVYDNYPTAFGCIHAGLMRRILIPTALFTTCLDTQVTDDLGIFDWFCSYDSNLSQVVIDAKFKPGKGLGNMMDAGDGTNPPTFKSNFVTLTRNATTYTSYSRNWWPNDSIHYPPESTSNRVTLDPDTLYAIDSDIETYGFTADINTALVILPNVQLRFTHNDTADCSYRSNNCMFRLYGTKRFYLDGGVLDGSNFADTLIELKNSELNHFNNVKITNAKEIGIYLTDHSDGNYFENTKVEYIAGGAGGPGIYINNSNGLAFDNIVIGNAKFGLTRVDNTYSIFNNMTFHNLQYGIVNEANSGDSYDNFTQTTMMGVLTPITWNDQTNYYDQYIIHNFLNINNNIIQDFALGNLSNSTASQIVTKGVNNVGLNPNSIKFTGNLVLETNDIRQGDECTQQVAPSNGVSAHGGNCVNEGNSDAVITHLGSTYHDSALAHSVMTSDTTTTEPHTSGISTRKASSIAQLSWFNFDYWQNFWGRQNSGNSNAAHSGYDGACESSLHCQILNNILSNADSIIFNRSEKITNSANGDFPTNGSTCPTEVGGNSYLTNFETSINYLKNAVEILNTGGNNNGLCESNETCLYTPNFGSYQGHGSLLRCDFDDQGGITTITGVKMYGWNTNGI